MNLERIEEALREGPPDEPTYVPGSFRRSRPTGWSFAMVAVSVAIALIAGIGIGSGIGAFRDGVGGPPSRPLDTADLQGAWHSDEIRFEAWIDALLVRGFTRAQINAFLAHDPFEQRVRYALRFIDDRIVVQAAYDDLPFQTLGEGTFTILEDGRLHYVEVVGGVEGGCQVLMTLAIDAERLSIGNVEIRGCDTDGRIANTLFFEIASYTRAPE